MRVPSLLSAPRAIRLALCSVALVLVGCDRLLDATADWRLRPLPLVDQCRLEREACSATLPDGGRIEVSFQPRPVAPARPVMLEVAVHGVEPVRVHVDFAGVEMNMGEHRTRLNHLGGLRYGGEATLPVCVTGGMLWQATVRVDTGLAVWAAPFRFESGSH